ncbi:MAG: hypothetical protein OXC63_09125 [Aestuariivita sp.]|nr:hypothetical protein [Aestuariivita sp.]MCY4346681.1 hypothetical protein [Aestuariivita sp.]
MDHDDDWRQYFALRQRLLGAMTIRGLTSGTPANYIATIYQIVWDSDKG